MNPWLFGLIGFSLGWLIEFLIDCLWWQKRRLQDPKSSIIRPLIEEPERRIHELESTIRQLKGKLSIIPGLETSLADKSRQYDELCLEVERLRNALEQAGVTTDSMDEESFGTTTAEHPSHQTAAHAEDEANEYDQVEQPAFPDNSETNGLAPPPPENDQEDHTTAPAGRKADNLQQIRGIGPKTEAVLNQLDIFTFEQIAYMTPEDVQRISEHLRFKGRIEKEDWIGQARELVLKGH